MLFSKEIIADATTILQLVCMEHEGQLPMKESNDILNKIIDSNEKNELFVQLVLEQGRFMQTYSTTSNRSFEDIATHVCYKFSHENDQYAEESVNLELLLKQYNKWDNSRSEEDEKNFLLSSINFRSLFTTEHEPFRFVPEISYSMLEDICPDGFNPSALVGLIALRRAMLS